MKTPNDVGHAPSTAAKGQAGAGNAKTKGGGRAQLKKAVAGRELGHDAQAAALSPAAGLLTPGQADEALVYNRKRQRRHGAGWVGGLQTFLGVGGAGTYDAATVTGVAAFQDDTDKLSVDGKVGPKTRGELKDKVTVDKAEPPSPAAPSSTNPAPPAPASAGSAAKTAAPGAPTAAQTAKTSGAEVGDATAAQETEAEAPLDVAALLQKLDTPLAPVVLFPKDKLLLSGMAGWLDSVEPALAQALPAFAGLKSGDADRQKVSAALTSYASFLAGEIADQGKKIRDHAVKLVNDSSVITDAEKQPELPSQTDAKDYQAKLRRLGQHAGAEALGASSALLTGAVSVAQDGALAILQGLSVLEARKTWKKGVKEPKASQAKAHRRKKEDPLNKIFADSGWSRYGVTIKTEEDGSQKISDWCGMFVGTHLFRGGGIDEELRSGYWHKSNVLDIFQYQQKENAKRSPKSIWADGEWHVLEDYHGARGSLRTWTTRAQIAKAMESKSALDIRPGDVVLIDHYLNSSSPSHITMVESYDVATQTLVTIEGNTKGIQAPDGKIKAKDGSEWHRYHSGADGSGIHTRDLTDMNTKTKSAWSDVRSAKKERLKSAPRGAYRGKKGATVFGVGRPSIVDFEEHAYATRAVPDKFKKMSPEEMRTLAKRKGKDAARAQRVGVKKPV